MYFQAMVAALVYLTAICNGLATGYSAIMLPQIRANNSGFEVDEEVESWIGKSRNLFYLHLEVTCCVSVNCGGNNFLFAHD
jgi:hypothetical protein